jgi:hypothetical protein
MGRRPRSTQHERCKPLDAQRSGKALGWIVVCLFAAWQTASPSLCPGEPTAVASDGGQPLAPVPVESLADAAVGWGALVAFPAPASGQKRPPCPGRAVERNEACWKRTESKPPCDYFEVEDGGACYMAVPERPKGHPVAGESQ